MGQGVRRVIKKNKRKIFMKQKSATKLIIEYCDKRIKETPNLNLKNNPYQKLKNLLLGKSQAYE